jgi:hypothetical protein
MKIRQKRKKKERTANKRRSKWVEEKKTERERTHKNIFFSLLNIRPFRPTLALTHSLSHAHTHTLLGPAQI